MAVILHSWSSQPLWWALPSYNSLGRQEDPSITPFVASVQTFYPGASPARIESLVTKPLEDALREHPDIKEVDSTSVTGVSSILIQADYYLSRSGHQASLVRAE